MRIRNKLIYLAEPIDLDVIGGQVAQQAILMLNEAGFTVFRPATAFEVADGLPIPEVQAVNELALAEAHGVFALMKAGVQSIGVPSEIANALRSGKPVVLASDLESTSYAVAGWKRNDNFRAVGMQDMFLLQGVAWLKATLEELGELQELAGRVDSASGPADRTPVETARERGRAWARRMMEESATAAELDGRVTAAREAVKKSTFVERYGSNPDAASALLAGLSEATVPVEVQEALELNRARIVQKYLNRQKERELADEMTRADELAELLKGRQFVFKAVKENAKLPERAYGTDAGFDLFTSDVTVLKPGETTWVPTGVAADIPDGYWGMVTGRSSTKAKRGLDVTLGVIDEGYSGELLASVFNPHNHEILIEEGERLVQLIFVPTAGPGEAVWGEIREKPRGGRGFGSSGAGEMHNSEEPEELVADSPSSGTDTNDEEN